MALSLGRCLRSPWILGRAVIRPHSLRLSTCVSRISSAGFRDQSPLTVPLSVRAMSLSTSPSPSMTSSDHAQPHLSSVPSIAINSVPLKVMTFNIWEDGKCGLDNIARVIHQEQAHVTGVQECRHGTLHALVDMLKAMEREDAVRFNREPHDQFYVAWSFRPYGGLRGGRNQEIGMGVISRLPIVQVYTSSDCSDAPICGCSGGTDPCHLCGSKSRLNACAVKIQAAPDQFFRFVCCHLRSAPYGPYLYKENPGASAAELAAGADKDGQGEDMGWIIEKVVDSPLCEPSLPTILCGDLNIPSHLDWEESTLQKRGFGRATLWPMSHKLSQHGFIDVYREHHPDPAIDPGYTWPAKPAEETGFDSIDDRIDFLYARTPLTLLCAATQALKAQNALTLNPTALTASPSPSQNEQTEELACVHSFRSLTLPSDAVAPPQSAFELLRLATDSLPPAVVSDILGHSYSSDESIPASTLFAQRTHLIPSLSLLFSELFSPPLSHNPNLSSAMVAQVASLHSSTPSSPAPDHPAILPAPNPSPHLTVPLNSLSPPVSPLSPSFNSPSPQLSTLSRSLSSSPVLTKWRRLLRDSCVKHSSAPALQLPSAVAATDSTATPTTDRLSADQISPALRHLFIDSCQNVTRSESSPSFWPSDHFAITAHLRLSAPLLAQDWAAEPVGVADEKQQQVAELHAGDSAIAASN